MSDGETPEEALANIRDGIEQWIEAARRLGHEILAPSTRHEPA
jgi:predicted RNase H-like HicB family nuclease